MKSIKDLPHKLVRDFENTFGVKLSDYWDFTGFAIVKFDDEFLKSGDRCMADTVRERYGQPAEDLIRELLDHERTR